MVIPEHGEKIMSNSSKRTNQDKIQEKIEFYWDNYKEYSYEASKIARQIAFGEGAIFGFILAKGMPFSIIIILGLSFLLGYFIFDLFHYFVGSWINRNKAREFQSCHNKGHIKKPSEVSVSENFQWPTITLYYIKLCTLIPATVFLGISLVRALLQPASQ